MEIKVDGSSVEFDRGIVGLPVLGEDAVVATKAVVLNSALISVVI